MDNLPLPGLIKRLETAMVISKGPGRFPALNPHVLEVMRSLGIGLAHEGVQEGCERMSRRRC